MLLDVSGLELTKLRRTARILAQYSPEGPSYADNEEYWMDYARNLLQDGYSF